MIKTSKKIIVSIKNMDESDFEKTIGVDLSQIGKNKEMLRLDLKKIGFYYSRYAKERSLSVIVTNEYNPLGTRKVIIPIFNGTDSINNLSSVRLELFFGPPTFVPLDKISNYKIIIEKEKKDVPTLESPTDKH